MHNGKIHLSNLPGHNPARLHRKDTLYQQADDQPAMLRNPGASVLATTRDLDRAAEDRVEMQADTVSWQGINVWGDGMGGIDESERERRVGMHDLRERLARLDERVNNHIENQSDQFDKLETQVGWAVEQLGVWGHRWDAWLRHKRYVAWGFGALFGAVAERLASIFVDRLF